jgi:hypothetical protein
MDRGERLLIIVIGGIMAIMVTGTVCFAAIRALTEGDGGLQNLLYGGLIGTGAFGGGVLFTVLGVQQRGTGSGGPTVNVDGPSTVNARSGGEEPPEVRRDDT